MHSDKYLVKNTIMNIQTLYILCLSNIDQYEIEFKLDPNQPINKTNIHKGKRTMEEKKRVRKYK